MLLLSHRESEVVKTSGSSDDNKKEFFETAPHVLKNSGLLLRSCFLNAVYPFLEILEKTETTFVSVPRKEKNSVQTTAP
ncbi:hypothetical protein GUJ56_07355 [Enterococcus hirae]|uniref:hypothetical protein n=1 Tax=Enterococcus hirae TaxID=1354 RepID=UPI000B9FAE29|nr:hypothetical protein [Enterococcus hirae]ASV81553.1 hypothetical protein A6J73_05240 [Enterococcus hirae]NAB48763.1 hypothetical protein [Enterococcus hirae]NAB75679.1 hypothetical protein [Enterococcus hirae]NAB79889.1 hypothetical protein [Enterococcus hirae]NAD45214.1 hypothetical protein [Enterococcus hirae]